MRNTNIPPRTAITPVKNAPASRSKVIQKTALGRREEPHQDVNADVNAGAHAVGRAEFRIQMKR